MIEQDLEKAGHTPGKDDQKYEMARRTVLAKYFGEAIVPKEKFADPSALFGV